MTQPTPDARTDGNVVRRRVLAYVTDAIIVGGAIIAAVNRLERSRGRRLVAGGIAAGIVATLYHILLEGTYGQTIGKKLFGIVVVRRDGEPCTYAAATIRTLFRFVDALPVAYLAAFAAIGLTDRHQRIGDLAAGTIVVRRSAEDEQ